MDLIMEYIATAQRINDINERDFDKKKIVKRNNKLASRLRAIASEIDSKHPEMKSNFYQLLFYEKECVREWVAHHILEVMNYDNECRTMALKQIGYTATHDEGISGFGNRLWLKEWFNEHPVDKDLLKFSD